MASAITASFGAGVGVDYCCPDNPVGRMSGSIRVPMGSRWFVEGHFDAPKTSSETYDFGAYPSPYYVLSGYRNSTRREFSGGGGFSYRLMPGERVSTFVGVGLSVWHRTTAIENTKVCQPIMPGSCIELDKEPRNYTMAFTSWSPQISAGIDVSVSKFVTLFGAVRIDDGVTPFGGVRVAITTRPAAPVVAPDVRVTSTNGSEVRGRLVSLTATQVVITQSGRNVVLPIGEVQHVTKVSHRLRNALMTGAILGYVGGYFLSCGTGDENDCWPEIGLLGAGIGVGAGAIAGKLGNQRAARDGRDVLYAGPSRSPATFAVAPVVSPRRAGIGMLVRW